MSLTAIDLYKKLPRTNCRDCGYPTCLAFAMQVIANKVPLNACKHITQDLLEQLLEESLPPVRKIVLSDDKCIGGESVEFRHERGFESPPIIGVLVEKEIAKINQLAWSWIGKVLEPELIAIKDTDEDLATTASKLAQENNKLLLICFEDISRLEKILKITAQFYKNRLLIYPATSQNIQQLATLKNAYNFLPILSAEGLDGIGSLATVARGLGFSEFLLDTKPSSVANLLRDQVLLRRKAIAKERNFGYPTAIFACNFCEDEVLLAAVAICKYAAMIILSEKAFKPHYLFPLLVLRFNIYSDPQRPLMLEEKIYPINAPNQHSPVIITTNFSLTYFTVSSEVESSNVGTWMCVMNTDGLSVLTAWAAGKFIPEKIAQFIRRCKIADHVDHRNIIIPGYVAHISGELEEELGMEWKVIVGPREAVDLPAFLQNIKY